ncbi:MAG: hypothetical protein ACPG4X_16400 [Pikeienuella sp.]
MNGQKSINWGYMLETGGRPTLRTQRQMLKRHGVDTSDEFGPWMRDKVEGVTSRPMSALKDRRTLSLMIREDHAAIVADVLCLGIGEPDVRKFVEIVHGIGARVIVANKDATYPPDRTEELIAVFVQARKAWYNKVQNAAARKAGKSKSK